MATVESAPGDHFTSHEVHFRRRSNWAISIILATIAIDVVAIILSPSNDATLFSRSSGRAYLIAAAAIATGLFFWGFAANRSTKNQWLSIASSTLLVTLPTTLFLIGRITLASIVITLVLAVVIGLSGVRFPIQAQRHASTLTWALVGALGWIGMVGVSSMDVEGRYQFPFVAALAAAAAFSLLNRSTSSVSLAISAAVVGVELSIALAFLKISPYVEATLWLIAASLVAITFILIDRRHGV